MFGCDRMADRWTVDDRISLCSTGDKRRELSHQLAPHQSPPHLRCVSKQWFTLATTNCSDPASESSHLLIMQSALLLLVVLICTICVSNSFVITNNRIQRSSVSGTKHPTALLMSKASQEKADEKKRKQAMVNYTQLLLLTSQN